MQKQFSTVAGVLAAGALGMLMSTPALAQATRTWVSGVGDDLNPCSRTAPCKTFAGAISKTAASGEINVLDPGGFGGVTITKAITINGGPGIAGVLVAGTSGITVNAGPSDVVILKGLELDGLGSAQASPAGIRFLAGGSLHVEDCLIYGFTSGISFTPSASSDLFVSRTSIRKNGDPVNVGSGIEVAPSNGSAFAFVSLDDVRLADNFRGFKAVDGTTAVATHTASTGNTANGFVIQSTSRAVTLTVDSSVSSQNGGTGVFSGGSMATARVTNSTITDNSVQGLQSSGGGAVISFGNNRVSGNAGGNTGPTQTVPQI